MSVEREIARSADHFQRIVWPNLSPLLGGGNVIPVETVTDSRMAQILDQLGGVDIWYVNQEQIFPVASRVQYTDRAWNTFTIRYSRPSGAPTEYDKRLRSIHNGSLYPRWTIQAYVYKDRLLTAAAVDTKHLIEVATKHLDQVRHNPADGVKFLFVHWHQCDPTHIRRYQRGRAAA